MIIIIIITAAIKDPDKARYNSTDAARTTGKTIFFVPRT
jgi:hypothetical protein